MNKCKTCRFYEPCNYGTWCKCEKFIFGYGYLDDSEHHGHHGDRSSWREHADDEVAVEDDEGWGFVPGPEFGCIHWEKVPDAS